MSALPLIVLAVVVTGMATFVCLWVRYAARASRVSRELADHLRDHHAAQWREIGAPDNVIRLNIPGSISLGLRPGLSFDQVAAMLAPNDDVVVRTAIARIREIERDAKRTMWPALAVVVAILVGGPMLARWLA